MSAVQTSRALTYGAVALALGLVIVLGGLAVGRVADRADARREIGVERGGPPPTGPDPTDDVVIIGDSITEQAESMLLDELQPDSVLRVRGRGGYRIEQMEPYAVEAASAEPEQVIINLGSNDVLLNWPLDRSVEAAAAEPEQVIINLGSNDVLLSWPLDRSVEAYRRMLDYFDDTRCIHLVTVNQGFESSTDDGLAFRALLLNGQIRELAAATGADVIDWSKMVSDYEAIGEPYGPLTSDSVHPNELGQKMIADAYRESLRTCL
jgi:lysophospholipase L1-like esterase